MPGDRCVVCGNSRKRDPSASFHRVRKEWISDLGLTIDRIKGFTRVCSRHFRNGDISNGPDKHLGVRFASPKKRGTARAQRVVKRALIHQLQSSKTFREASSSSTITEEAAEVFSDDEPRKESEDSPIIASVGEPLRTDYQVV